MSTISKVTSQGQISIPASMRRKFGIGPGASLAWKTENDRLTVRRIGAHTCAEIHAALFADKPACKTLAALKAGIVAHIRSRHARD